jgi:hypothetical protein
VQTVSAATLGSNTVATNTTSTHTSTSVDTGACARRDDVATLTIKHVADACGMAQPVIAQLVPRRWVDGVGWMYGRQDLDYAVELADRLRNERQARRAVQHDTGTARPGGSTC